MMVGNAASVKLDPSTFALFAFRQAHVVSLKSRLNSFIKPILKSRLSSFIKPLLFLNIVSTPASVALGGREEEEEAG